MLYFENLYIKNCVQIKIIEFTLNQSINCHSNAYIKAKLNQDAFEAIMCWRDNEPIIVSDKESGCNLFAGVVREFKIYWERGIQEVSIELVSGTYLLDLEKKKISYQKKQSYRELIEDVIPDKAMLVYLAQEQMVSNLLVQYEETDWRFIDRLASHLKTCIIPEINTSWGSRFYFGMREGIYRGEVDSFSYLEGMDSRFHSAKIHNRNAMKQDYVYYQIATYDDFHIGDELTFQDQLWHIGEKSAKLKHGVIQFYYRLYKEIHFMREPVFNTSLHGKEIQGTVKACKGELLRIALEMDKEKKEQDTFFYQWMPESGNLLYCMPELGQNLTLYFCNDDEKDAICINSTRINKEFPTKQWNQAHKQFLTHGYEKIQLRKEQMEIRNLDSYISIDEKQGVSICSEKEIHIQAVERVEAKTKRLHVKSEQEIDLIKEDLFTPAMITLKDDISVRGGKLQTEPKIWYDDQPIPDCIFDKGKDLEYESEENNGLGMLARR